MIESILSSLSGSVSNVLLMIFTGFLALFSLLQFCSLRKQEEILEKEYKPDPELYLEEKDRPVLCIHNNGGSSAVRVEVESYNNSDADTYEMDGRTAEIPVIEPMETVKVEIMRLSKEDSLLKTHPTIHKYVEKVGDGDLDHSDLNITIEVGYKDSRGEHHIERREFNLIEDISTENGIIREKDPYREISYQLSELDDAVRGVGNALAEFKRYVQRRDSESSEN
ncbi:hypothetical protein ACK3SF_04035 [Candidatus Nanosalina sp. VS9-1]|uniref:hypothetical protein n=1 Tax=Candidatus Nanosalina sp. VS9-1 TaxID=3388566 RepID=UPI0039E07772